MYIGGAGGVSSVYSETLDWGMFVPVWIYVSGRMFAIQAERLIRLGRLCSEEYLGAKRNV